jgi:hypothetical protein
MVAFDVSGGWRWAVWGYTPLMATADGGVIATSDWVSATVFDKNGGAVAQMAHMPTYSWKGTYQRDSVSSVIPMLDLAATIATSHAAAPGGNLTGNGFSLVHHTFGLVFCGTNPDDDGPCPQIDSIAPLVPVTFSYRADISDTNYTQAADFGVTQPDQAEKWRKMIKVQALKQYQAAFEGLPAIVAIGQKPTPLYGCGGPTTPCASNTPPKFEHTTYVSGQWVLPNQAPRNLKLGDLDPYPPAGWTPDFGSNNCSAAKLRVRQ